MARDYNPDDGGYSGPMKIADIFAGAVRDTIESRKAAEKTNLDVMANQQANDLRTRELEQRKELAVLELDQRQRLQSEELGLRREEMGNRMANNEAELAIRREALAADKLRIEASVLGTRSQRAKAEAILANTRMAASLLGITPPAEGEGAPAAAAPGTYTTGDNDVSSPNAPALKALQDSLAAGMSGAPMPGGPDANDPTLPGSPDPRAAADPGILLDPSKPVAPMPGASPSAVPPAPMPGAEGATGPAGPAAPGASILPPAPTAPEDDAEYRLKLKRLLAMKRLAKDPNTPVDYQIKLEEEAIRLEQDPAFAMQVKNHAAKIQLAQDKQVLPTAIFASSADKQIAFGATFPHLRFAITAPGEDVPKMVKPDGSPIGDAEFKVIKAAWDQFEFKPGQAIPKVTTSPFGFTPPAPATSTPPGAAAPPAVPLSLAQRRAAPAQAAINKEWDNFKTTTASDLPKAFDDNELPSAIQSIRLGEREALAEALFEKGSSLVEEKEVSAVAGYAMGGMGGVAPAGKKKVIVFKQIKAPNGEMMDAFEVLKLAAGADPRAQAPTLTPEKQAKADELFQ